MNQIQKDKILMTYEGEDLKEAVKDLKKQFKMYEGMPKYQKRFAKTIKVLEEAI